MENKVDIKYKKPKIHKLWTRQSMKERRMTVSLVIVMGEKMSKKIFMIAVTDKEDSLNRKYTESIYDLLKVDSSFVREYKIEPHYKLATHDLHQSLCDALNGDSYEGYIVLLDCLEGDAIYNPNVMFELGAIFYSGKPYVAISSHPKETAPFDFNDIKIIDVPQVIVDYVKKYNIGDISAKAHSYFYLENQSGEENATVIKFLDQVFHQYRICLDNTNRKITEETDLKNILDEVKEMKKLISNTAEYIDGEKAAFRNLGEAVKRAQISLRTTRFANESIVKSDSIAEKKFFMESLYEASKEISDKFFRIICNNHPAKWKDIYDILFFGGNGVKVFVRKHDFSIHFELVVIDDKVAFIHFYQANSRKEEGQSVKEIERLKSTLKIQGSSICQKLADIFDRLHHRDFAKGDPSRTLLGIPVQDTDLDEECKKYGCFVVDNSIPELSLYSDRSELRKKHIIQMFKDAFLKWNVNDFHDKVIMVSGIALVEGNDRFIKEMKEIGRLDKREFEEARKLYDENQGN